MLNEQKWMTLAPEMMIAFKQAVEEGKITDGYEPVCQKLANSENQEFSESDAAQVYKQLLDQPSRPDYPYFEPSDWAEITSNQADQQVKTAGILSEQDLADKVSGAWIGRIAGCLLGKPVEGFSRDRITRLLKGTKNYPLSRYISSQEFSDSLITELSLDINRCWIEKAVDFAPFDDDTNYTTLALKMIENYGFGFTPDDVLEAWLMWLPMFSCCTAERVAYRNAAQGMYAPATALHNNPYREWIGAQIRADFFGYINPDNPQKASEMAWRDASISHVKNGIYGEMFVAAMVAAAYFSNNCKEIIQIGLSQIPLKCRLREAVEDVISWFDAGLTSEEAVEHIHNRYDENDPHDWCHTIPNAMIVVMALLYGNGEFARSICLAVEAAFDTDCNGATVGSIVGIMHGESGIPDYWHKQFHSKLETTITGCNYMTVDELASRTVKLIREA